MGSAESKPEPGSSSRKSSYESPAPPELNPRPASKAVRSVAATSSSTSSSSTLSGFSSRDTGIGVKMDSSKAPTISYMRFDKAPATGPTTSWDSRNPKVYLENGAVNISSFEPVIERRICGHLTVGDRVVWIATNGKGHRGTVRWLGMVRGEQVAGLEFDVRMEGLGSGWLQHERKYQCREGTGAWIAISGLMKERDYDGKMGSPHFSTLSAATKKLNEMKISAEKAHASSTNNALRLDPFNDGPSPSSSGFQKSSGNLSTATASNPFYRIQATAQTQVRKQEPLQIPLSMAPLPASASSSNSSVASKSAHDTFTRGKTGSTTSRQLISNGATFTNSARRPVPQAGPSKPAEPSSEKPITSCGASFVRNGQQQTSDARAPPVNKAGGSTSVPETNLFRSTFASEQERFRAAEAALQSRHVPGSKSKTFFPSSSTSSTQAATSAGAQQGTETKYESKAKGKNKNPTLTEAELDRMRQQLLNYKPEGDQDPSSIWQTNTYKREKPELTKNQASKVEKPFYDNFSCDSDAASTKSASSTDSRSRFKQANRNAAFTYDPLGAYEPLSSASAGPSEPSRAAEAWDSYEPLQGRGAAAVNDEERNEPQVQVWERLQPNDAVAGQHNRGRGRGRGNRARGRSNFPRGGGGKFQQRQFDRSNSNDNGGEQDHARQTEGRDAGPAHHHGNGSAQRGHGQNHSGRAHHHARGAFRGNHNHGRSRGRGQNGRGKGNARNHNHPYHRPQNERVGAESAEQELNEKKASTFESNGNAELDKPGKDVKSSLECPICFENLRPPVYQCANGHVYCKICVSKLTTCSICRIAMTEEIRCLVFDRLLTGEL